MATQQPIVARASWTDAMDAFLVDGLLEQARAGKKADSGFKKDAWTAVTTALNATYKLALTVQQIKTRSQTLKSKYQAVQHMLQWSSGFGWDDARGVVLVHDTVWENYLKQYPKAVDYRYKPLRFYYDLVELHEGTFATGQFALSSDEPSPADFEAAAEHAAPPPPTRDAQEGQNTEPEGALQPLQPATPTPTPTTTSAPTTTNNAQGSDRGSVEDPTKKRRRVSGGFLIAESISEVAGEMRSRNNKHKVMSASQKAIKILQKVYATIFTTDDLVKAFDVMLHEAKAKIFIVMEEGPARDLWLRNQLQTTTSIPNDA